jgi:lysophospholipase L1-like esterase
MEKPVRRLAASSLAALVLVLLGAPSSQAAAPLRYVALGDSYSAASGVLPPDPTAPPSCLRSTSNYPHVIAGATGAQLTDVTCGGAETGDFFAPQYTGVAPQLDAVDADAQLVTMTIGGNDSGVFINSIVVNALRAVRVAAPSAEVAILGYPWIMPTTGGCFDRMPVAEGDVPYLRGIQATLNDAVRRAAAATGATYVDLNKVSDGHDACRPLGVRWVEPVLQGTNAVVVHPNTLGESQMAARAMKVLGLR